EVRTAAIDAAEERLRLVSLQIAEISRPTLDQRLEELSTAALDSSLVVFLASPTVERRAAAAARLEQISSPMLAELVVLHDSSRVVEIQGALAADSILAVAASAAARAALPDSGVQSRFFSVGERGYYWLSIPVMREG